MESIISELERLPGNPWMETPGLRIGHTYQSYKISVKPEIYLFDIISCYLSGEDSIPEVYCAYPYFFFFIGD